MNERDPYDVVVAGAGPAGLAAALTLGRARRDVLVLDSGEPRNAPAETMHNVLGRDGTAPGALRADGRRELAAYPTVELRDVALDTATRDDGNGFVVALAGGESVRARRLVLATGVVDALPSLPGIRELWGRSVLHCPYCHGYEVRGRALAVLGAGPHQMFIATLLRRYSDDIVLLANGEQASEPEALAAAGVSVREEPVERLAARAGRLERIEFAGGATLARDALFAGAPWRQRSDVAVALGAAFLDDGCVEVDDFGRTSVPGLLAAGDMARRRALPGPMAAVSVAAASGLVAAVAADQDLHAEDSGLASPIPPLALANAPSLR